MIIASTNLEILTPIPFNLLCRKTLADRQSHLLQLIM